MKRALHSVAIALSLLLLVTGCTAGTAGNSEPVKGPSSETQSSGSPKLLKIAIGGTLPAADPHMAYGFPANLPHFAMFDALTRFTDTGELESALATEWKSVDPTTWRFTLRKGVKFHNGEDFRANSVKATIDRVLDANNKLTITSRVGNVKEARVVDEYTVDIITKGPDALLPKVMSVVLIIPATYYSQVGAQKFTDNPVGTGAFKFKELVVGDHFSLVAAEDSWRGRPRVDQVEIKIVPDASSRSAALKTGDVDIAHNLPTDQLEDLKKSGAQVVTTVLGRTATIFVDPLKDTPLKDKRVRQAVLHAVDTESIVKTVMGGYGRAAAGQILGPDGFGYNPNVKAYPYDPAKAKALLKEAGFPNGFPIKLETPVGVNVNDKETAEAVAGFLLAVGINAQVSPLEYAGFLDRTSGRNVDGRAPLFLYGPDYLPLMDGDFPLSFFASSHPSKRYNNPQFDKLFLETRSTLDIQKRKENFQAIQAMLHEDAVILPLYQMPLILGVNKNITGVVARPDQTLWLDKVGK